MRAIYNTKEKGRFHYLIFHEDGGYVAVCLNLNILEYGKDPDKLRKSIEEAALSYLKTVRKKNLSDENLNVVPDKKYLELYKQANNADVLKPKPRKRAISTEGNANTPYISTLLKIYSSHNTNLVC